MITLFMIVAHILRDRVPKRCLSAEDHPMQTLFFYGTDKSFRERVQGWGSWRQSNNVDTLPRVGIGLAICRSIIEAHKGRLWAAASELVGAAFMFTLPAPQTPISPESTHSSSIKHVDDLELERQGCKGY